MKLIIDIVEEEYELIVNDEACGLHYLTRAIANGTPIPDNATVCDIEQIRAEIEREADYQDAYVNADVAKGMYLALEIFDKYKGGDNK